MVAQARFPEADSGAEVNSISCMEHHLRDDQAEIVSFSLSYLFIGEMSFRFSEYLSLRNSVFFRKNHRLVPT